MNKHSEQAFENNVTIEKRSQKSFNTKGNKIALLVVAGVFAVFIIAGAIDFFKTSGYTYRNEKLGFEITIPTYWDGKCLIEEKDNSVLFYHTQTREVYDFAGLIFYIERRDGKLSEQEISEPGNRTIAMYANDYTYVFGQPTDVQYPIWSNGDAKVNKKLADEYVELTKYLEKMKKSIKKIK